MANEKVNVIPDPIPEEERQYKLVRCTINGKKRQTMVDVRASLTDMLRNDYSLTSVKKAVRSANAVRVRS